MFGLNLFKRGSNKWEERAQKVHENGKRLAGFYHENYLYRSKDNEKFLFRFPIKGAPNMDPHLFKEADVLPFVEKHGLSAPKLLYRAKDDSFIVEEFVEGILVETSHPVGQDMPAHVLDQIVEFYAQTATMTDFQELFDKRLVKDWPSSGPMGDFFKAISDVSRGVYQQNKMLRGKELDYIGIPETPYLQMQEMASSLSNRPWVFIHSDMHRANMIVDGDARLRPIDWEQALVGDLVYCFAVHLHISRHDEQIKADLIRRVKKALPKKFLVGFDKDLEFYLTYEALKSIITDTVRFPQALREEMFSPKKEAELCLYYSDNLKKIAPLFGNKTPDAGEVLRLFQQWGGNALILFA
tara:strand:+ start:342 stop:1403 length:1062 start_codon:yes stop_codon:yes gene_type:complete